MYGRIGLADLTGLVRAAIVSAAIVSAAIVSAAIVRVVSIAPI